MRHNTDKMVMHTMVQGLEYAAIFKDFMEEYVTNDNLQTHLPTSIQKIYKNLLMPKRAPKGAWLTRAQDKPRSNKGTQGRRSTQPDSRPTFCNKDTDPAATNINRDARLAQYLE